MATTLSKPFGTFVSPFKLYPHATTFPSLISAKLWALPPAIAVTLPNPLGIVLWPLLFAPHPTMVPSDLSARL
jgi:hypothetical protein